MSSKFSFTCHLSVTFSFKLSGNSFILPSDVFLIHPLPIILPLLSYPLCSIISYLKYFSKEPPNGFG